jgi:hypothetical protein
VWTLAILGLVVYLAVSRKDVEAPDRASATAPASHRRR